MVLTSLTTKQIREMVGKGDIEGAFSKLLSIPLDAGVQNEIILLQSRFNLNNIHIRKGFADPIKEGQIEVNKIVDSLLKILNNITIDSETAEKETTIPDAAKDLYSVGLALYRSDELEKAVEVFTRAIGIYNHYGDAYFFRAICKADMGLFAKAINDYGRALEKNVTSPDDVFNHMAICYYRLGDKENALRCIEKIKTPLQFPHLHELRIQIFNLK